MNQTYQPAHVRVSGKRMAVNLIPQLQQSIATDQGELNFLIQLKSALGFIEPSVYTPPTNLGPVYYTVQNMGSEASRLLQTKNQMIDLVDKRLQAERQEIAQKEVILKFIMSTQAYPET